ncbi:MAG: PEGA domain-containing protein [Deltaproteobacteria bacterium]|nr:PEGA domain-containing protein [Deltaproteobacteria bacterium]
MLNPRMLILAVLLLSAIWPNHTQAAPKKEVLAVFTIRTRGVKLSDKALDRYTDYLATQLTATGRFSVVPREQIKARLREQKKASYELCMDRSCQIAIGRELAAQKSLDTQVMKLGSRCGVTATIYDLKRSTTAAGASAMGECNEDAIIAALNTVVKRLTARGGNDARTLTPVPSSLPPSPHPAVALATKVAVDIASNPSRAEVFIDGQPRGYTPLRLLLAKDQRYALRLERHHRQTMSTTIQPTSRRRLRYELQPNAESAQLARYRTEYFSFGFSSGLGTADTEDTSWTGVGRAPTVRENLLLLMGSAEVLTWKWPSLYWTAFEFRGGGGPEDGGVVFAGTRAGLLFTAGYHGQHQFRFGAGLGFGMVQVGSYVEYSDTDTSSHGGTQARSGLMASPSLRYQYHTRGRFFIGFDAAVMLPIIGEGDGHYPVAVLFSVPMGLCASSE